MEAEAPARVPPPPEGGWTLVNPEPDAPRPLRGPPPDQPVRPPNDFGKCVRSRYCQLEGFCTEREGGLCIAATDDDCEGSDACLGGRCTARDGHCIAADDDDCRGSVACSGYGRCAHDGDEACMAISADDCQASTRCQRLGECRLEDGACIK